MELIKETVRKLLSDLNGKQKMEGRKIISLLDKALTKEEKRHIKVISFKEGMLKINVDAPAFLYQLSLKRPLIFSRLQKASKGELNLKEITFRAGDIG